MKYRKKPDNKVYEPEQYFGFNAPLTKGVCLCHLQHHRLAHVHTIHDNQLVLVENGDWIMPEPDGEHFYPIKDKIFQETYEPLTEAGEGADEKTKV